MTTAKTTDKDAATPGDNRGADDIDGNKAGAPAGNKAPGPDEPEPAAKPASQERLNEPRRSG